MLRLKNTAIEDLWRTDLDNFINVLDEIEKDMEKDMLKRLA